MPLDPIKAKIRRERYYEKNREKVLERNRRWKEKNPDGARNWYHNNREAHLLTIQRRRARIQSFIQQEKVNRGCSECGFKEHHAALHWHHPNDDKEIAVAMCFSMKKALAEMAKCIVLCANCHAIHHWESKPLTKLELLSDGLPDIL